MYVKGPRNTGKYMKGCRGIEVPYDPTTAAVMQSIDIEDSNWGYKCILYYLILYCIKTKCEYLKVPEIYYRHSHI